MDISGRIQATLREAFPERHKLRKIYHFMAIAAAGERLPHVALDEDSEAPDDKARWPNEALRVAGLIRILPKSEDWDGLHRYARGRFTRWLGDWHQLAVAADSPARALWYHWLLLLARKNLGFNFDLTLLQWLWTKGFSCQGASGFLHDLDSETLLDRFVYDELTALHAAYNSAKIIGGPDAPAMMDQVRHAIRWHVENTQPDNTTNEPWALAAFAALDDTHTFAEQQLHDTLTWLQNAPPLPNGKVPVAIGLLADAVMTLENW